MLIIVKNKKNHASALVDIKNRVGPIPIYFAMSDVGLRQHFETGSAPRSSNRPN